MKGLELTPKCLILRKIISGAQTGADQAGLFAGKIHGFETGGNIPRGFKTQAGAMPELKNDFGIIEHPSDKYPPRTELNVKQSDATFRFASNFNSAGERCTLKFITKHQKPHMDFEIVDGECDLSMVESAIEFLVNNQVEVLNIAGNADGSDLRGVHFCATLVFLDAIF